MSDKKIGVLLSGCGVYDGSEIHEAVLTLLFLAQRGGEAVCIAPNVNQAEVINHLTGEKMNETRNILVESARIARGQVKDISAVSAGDLDGLILPGGFGAAKNLCEFASKGPTGEVLPEVSRLILEMFKAKKPIGGLCIAPATLAMALKEYSVEVTIGNDVNISTALGMTGAKHKSCCVEEIAVDEANNVVTTPAYMLGPGIKDVAIGIEKLVARVLAMA
jgi:enhancing lycopene biosynthesis protein 2